MSLDNLERCAKDAVNSALTGAESLVHAAYEGSGQAVGNCRDSAKKEFNSVCGELEAHPVMTAIGLAGIAATVLLRLKGAKLPSEALADLITEDEARLLAKDDVLETFSTQASEQGFPDIALVMEQLRTRGLSDLAKLQGGIIRLPSPTMNEIGRRAIELTPGTPAELLQKLRLLHTFASQANEYRDVDAILTRCTAKTVAQLARTGVGNDHLAAEIEGKLAANPLAGVKVELGPLFLEPGV